MTTRKTKKTAKAKPATPAQEALQITWLLKGNLKNARIAYLRIGSLLSKVRDNPWAQQELFANIIDLPWEGDFSWRPGNILENLSYSYVKQKHSNR